MTYNNNIISIINLSIIINSYLYNNKNFKLS